MRTALIVVAIFLTGTAARATEECLLKGPQYVCSNDNSLQAIKGGEDLPVVVKCKSGTYATGGGAYISAAQEQMALVESFPLVEATDGAVGWFAKARNHSTTTVNSTIVAFALCR